MNARAMLIATGLITVATVGVVIGLNQDNTISRQEQERVFQEAWDSAAEDDKEGTCLAMVLFGEEEVTRLFAQDLPEGVDASYMVHLVREECSK